MLSKTDIQVLQESIRTNASTYRIAEKLGKANSTVYDSIHELQKQEILDKNKRIMNNRMAKSLKKLILLYPYDFSFISGKNTRLLKAILVPKTFSEIMKETGLSRTKVSKTLKNLTGRAFVTKEKQKYCLTHPAELVDAIGAMEEVTPAPAKAVLLREKPMLYLLNKPGKMDKFLTGFSLFTEKGVPIETYYDLYRNTRPNLQDIFDDAEAAAKTMKEKLILGLFYVKYRKRLKKNKGIEEILRTKDFMEMRSDYGI